MQCCGVDGPLDYRRLSLPWSCCSRPEHAYESACDTHYKRGCLAVVSEQIKHRLLITAFSAAIIAIFQVQIAIYFTQAHTYIYIYLHMYTHKNKCVYVRLCVQRHKCLETTHTHTHTRLQK